MMKKFTKAALIAAASLTAVGLIIIFCSFAAAGFRFANLSTRAYADKTYPIYEPVRSISIDADVTDIRFLPSTSDQCEVVCTERQDSPYEVSVEHGTLKIRERHNRRWFHFGWYWHPRRVEMQIYLPEGQYSDLRINSTAGDISVPAGFGFEDAHVETTAGNIAFSAETTGDLTVKSTVGDNQISTPSAQNVSVESTTGDIELLGVTAQGHIRISTTVGEIDLNQCDAASLDLQTTTGDIDVTLLSGKNFDARSTTGDVDIPNPSQGGSCKIRTKTGDIHVNIG